MPVLAFLGPSAHLAPWPLSAFFALRYHDDVAYLAVALGGAIGATARYALAGFVHRFASPSFPWGTFIVNISGCFVFGLIAGLGDARGGLGSLTRAFLLIGILGGYTTFSSFTFETMGLLRSGQMPQAIANVVGQVVLGLLAFWAAWALATAAAGGRP